MFIGCVDCCYGYKRCVCAALQVVGAGTGAAPMVAMPPTTVMPIPETMGEAVTTEDTSHTVAMEGTEATATSTGATGETMQAQVCCLLGVPVCVCTHVCVCVCVYMYFVHGLA